MTWALEDDYPKTKWAEQGEWPGSREKLLEDRADGWSYSGGP